MAVAKPPNAWSALLASGLHVSAEEAGGLDAKALVRLVDRRWRVLRREGLQRLGVQAEELERALSDRRRQSLASIGDLAQRWPLQGAPGLGAFRLQPAEELKRLTAPDLEVLKEAAGAQLRRMRRSASDSRLGRTLARSLSGRDLTRAAGVAPAEWDLFKSLDNNLRSLERTFRESTAKQRKAAARRRVKPAHGDENAAPSALVPSFSKGAFPDSLPDLQAALSNFQRTVEKHMPKPNAVDPGALVTEFIRTRTPLKLARRGADDTPATPRNSLVRDESTASDSEPSTSGASTPRFELIAPWQILGGPLPRLPWDLPRGGASSGALDALQERDDLEDAQRGLRGSLQSLLRKRRRPGLERMLPRSVRDPGRSIAIVTTASLPWMTGTSVNPLLRAAYLARDGTRKVTLLLPWLAPSDQKSVHPGRTFSSPAEQTDYVRAWVADRVGFTPDIKFTFYPGRWAPDKCSILPVGDITAYVPDSEADVAVLEEPEHLTWYHHGVRWTDKFSHVVGVVHTNYLEYARREENGGVKEAVLRFVNNWVVRAYCHKVVKLSDAVQELPRASTCFVHGVSPRFLSIGEERAKRAAARAAAAADAAAAASAAAASLAVPAPSADSSSSSGNSKGVYFIGKVVWGKGYTELLDLIQKHCASPAAAATPVSVDVFGGGDDLRAVKESAANRALPLNFMGPRDHADDALHDYSVFVNPSLSDVVATTTAEALAMGKWVVVAEHPSNAFFTGRFRNCLTYRTPDEFSAHLARALSSEPAPLSADERAALSWEAATDRFMDVAEPEARPRRGAWVEGVADWAAAQVHQTLTGVEPLRGLAGAGPNTKHAPESLEDWRPCRWTGGPLDRKDRQ